MRDRETHTITDNYLVGTIIWLVKRESGKVIGDVMRGARIKEPGGVRGGRRKRGMIGLRRSRPRRWEGGTSIRELGLKGSAAIKRVASGVTPLALALVATRFGRLRACGVRGGCGGRVARVRLGGCRWAGCTAIVGSNWKGGGGRWGIFGKVHLTNPKFLMKLIEINQRIPSINSVNHTIEIGVLDAVKHTFNKIFRSDRFTKDC